MSDVIRHLRSGADGLESLASKIYVNGESLLALATHAENQSESYLVHTMMSRFGVPAGMAPYHKVVCYFHCYISD